MFNEWVHNDELTLYCMKYYIYIKKALELVQVIKNIYKFVFFFLNSRQIVAIWQQCARII